MDMLALVRSPGPSSQANGYVYTYTIAGSIETSTKHVATIPKSIFISPEELAGW